MAGLEGGKERRAAPGNVDGVVVAAAAFRLGVGGEAGDLRRRGGRATPSWKQGASTLSATDREKALKSLEEGNIVSLRPSGEAL